MSYLCNLFAIIIFIFIPINHMTSLIQTNLSFWTFVKSSGLALLIKVLPIKKSVYLLNLYNSKNKLLEAALNRLLEALRSSAKQAALD